MIEVGDVEERVAVVWRECRDDTAFARLIDRPCPVLPMDFIESKMR